jgi:hypothetical protein
LDDNTDTSSAVEELKDKSQWPPSLRDHCSKNHRSAYLVAISYEVRFESVLGNIEVV